VAEHGPLQIPLVDAKAQEQAQQATEEPVAQRQEHLAKSEGSSTHPPNGEVRAPIEFLYPTRQANSHSTPARPLNPIVSSSA
jgi:hypothetical protein